LEGNGTRPSHKGSGFSEDGVAFTLNATEQHQVSYAMTTGCYTQVCEEQSPTLQARDYKDAPVVNQSRYVVRRLTPTECALLQGFPPWWCAGLETPEPAETDIAFWSEVWETHRRITETSSKPKSRNQIVKWLQDPHSDAAEYKMWGNGVALPCVFFVLSGIVYYTQSGEQ
jgi:DNA (cytosine-5)-methyltransferase 1